MPHLCPCSSGKPYTDCCGIFIEGNLLPKTPEQLMRSRYTAYTQADIGYIARTMQGPAAKDFDPLEASNWAKQVKWLKLKIIRTSTTDDKGYVEFVARYIFQGKKHELHETSEFHWIDDRWFYIDGKME